ncbi:MAG: hypothetical protein LBS96_06110 [Oscillospiraceae bacterium]|jgi:hypothetical protein|nr:hypothetical protein [Oscillospiraceae bacterium]
MNRLRAFCKRRRVRIAVALALVAALAVALVLTVGAGKNPLAEAEVVSLLVYHTDGTPYEGETDSAYTRDMYTIQSPKEAGEYIYAAEITYERGKVTYGCKVIVVPK